MAEEKKKRIKILKQTTADRKVAREGDVIEVSENEAQLLIGRDLAEETKDAVKSAGKFGKKKETKPAPQTPAPQAPPAGGESK